MKNPDSMFSFEHDASQDRAIQPRRPEQALPLAVAVARAVADARCDDVLVLDVRGLCQVTDYIVLGTGTSERQIRSAAEDARLCAKGMGGSVFGREGESGGAWVIIDLVDVIVHVFDTASRGHYDLETLWGDAPQVVWSRPSGESPGAGAGAIVEGGAEAP